MNNLSTQKITAGLSLNEVLTRFRRALAPHVALGKLYEFPFAPLDRLDLPLWTVALVGADGALSDGYGYGIDETRARASAWGETLEWFFAREHLKHCHRRTASFDELRESGIAAVDPVTLNLSAGSSYRSSQSVIWVEARRYISGETVLVPIEFAAPRYADIRDGMKVSDMLATPITNGLGAGVSLEHAIAQGALEVLQRDGNSVNYRALDQGIGIELDEVRDEETKQLLDYLEEQDVEVIVKLASTDFGITNLYVVGYDRNPELAPHALTLSACGEAAHPNRERALAKALREFTSSRARKHFMHGSLERVARHAPPAYLEAFSPTTLRDEDDRAFLEMSAWLKMPRHGFLTMLRERVLKVQSSVKFSELPTIEGVGFGNANKLIDFLTQRFADEGYEILYVDFSDKDSGVSVVKTIIPGFEVETMTYERIGHRNLRRLLQRDSPLVGLSSPPPDAKPILLTKKDESTFGGKAWFSSAAREQAIGNLYALYREPGRHVIAFAEEMNMQTIARG